MICIIKIVILNTKNEILKIEDIAKGGTNLVNIPIKDILSEPIRMKAPKFILVHNHPSGNPTPSQKDIVFTDELNKASQQLGLTMLDHIVIGKMNYVSIFSLERKTQV